MPTLDELPAGPVRDFVDILFTLYRAARRPTLEDISKHILEGGYPATASKETIRKMLRGTTIPTHWETVETVIRALCDLADIDPERTMTMGRRTGRPMYWAEEIWHQVLDQPAPRSAAPWLGDPDDPGPRYPDDPWPDELDSVLPDDPLSDDEKFEDSYSYDGEPPHDYEPEESTHASPPPARELSGVDLITRELGLLSGENWDADL
jgi:hypothetical protein